MKKQLYQLMADGDTKGVIDLLRTYCEQQQNQKLRTAVIHQSSRYEELLQRQNANSISSDDIEVIKGQLRVA
ncbi:MAG: hypothetical protein AAFV25_11870, partial [Bacteroidota bacterium]